MQIKVKSTFAAIERQILRDAAAVANKARIGAINHMANAIAKAEREEIEKVFDRPTPWVVNSIRARTSTGGTQPSSVKINDRGSGIPGSWILEAHIEGGTRRHKRFERALQGVGAMPKGWFAVPTKFIGLDSYGNVPGPRIVQLLSYFKATKNKNIGDKRRASMARGSKKARGVRYFAIGPGKNIKPGIYEKTSFGPMGSAIRPLILFVRTSKYRKRYDFHGVAERVYNARWREILDQHMDEALK